MSHPVDVHVGHRIRHRRWTKGMTQQQLGDKVGVQFQQIQKYELGTNRVAASRLWDIARALDVQVTYFYDGLELSDTSPTLMIDRQAAQLLGMVMTLPVTQRQAISDLARSIAKETRV